MSTDYDAIYEAVEQLAKIAKANNISAIQVDGLRIEMHPDAAAPPVQATPMAPPRRDKPLFTRPSFNAG